MVQWFPITIRVADGWRLCRFQPDCRPVQHWSDILLNPLASRARRKQLLVALGRRFAVDWWRIRTGRCAPETLGLTINPKLNVRP